MSPTAHLSALRHALRGLLLPIAESSEDAAVEVAAKWLEGAEVDPPDWAQWIALRQAAWMTSPHEMPVELAHLIQGVLDVGFPEDGRRLGRKYPRLHRELMKKSHLKFAEASAVIAFLPLIATLRTRHQMSASQIARVVSARSAELDIHWETVGRLLASIGRKPAPPTLSDVRALGEADGQSALERFADAGVSTSAEILDGVASSMGFGEGMGELLLRLTPEADGPHVAYLQMLEYQLVLAEYLDHPLSIAYEFAPRGQAADEVFRRWPAGMRAVANPMLNNAKRTYSLDINWARGSDEKTRNAAYALAVILEGLDAMPWLARREIASWMRAWLYRVRSLLKPATRKPIALAPLSMDGLLDVVQGGNTETFGVIEQRVVDAASVVLHPNSEGWWSRGAGDSVYASNRSRKKLGDVDYQNSSTRKIFAYEAHGGQLSAVYLEGHLETLRQTLPGRIEELKFIDDIGNWSVALRFIAHGFSDAAAALAGSLPADRFFGLALEVELWTYEQLFSAAGPVEAWQEVFATFVDAPLTAAASPEAVFERYRQAVEEQSASNAHR